MEKESGTVYTIFKSLSYDIKAAEPNKSLSKNMPQPQPITKPVMEDWLWKPNQYNLKELGDKYIEFVQTKLVKELTKQCGKCPYENIEKDIVKVVKDMRYLQEANIEPNTGIDRQHYVPTSNFSIRSIIFEWFCAIRFGMPRIRYDHSELTTCLSAVWPIGESIPLALFDIDPNDRFCTLIVCGRSDIESAATFAAAASNELLEPWRIRNILVQECIAERFNEILSDKCRLIKQKTANPMEFVYGQTRKYFDYERKNIGSDIVTVNVFRTIKEATALANADNGGSISAWTEDMSIAYEMYNNIEMGVFWINCYEVFDNDIPMSFRPGGYVLGSELSYSERALRSELHLFDGAPEKRKPLSPEAVYSKSFIKGNYHYEAMSFPWPAKRSHNFFEYVRHDADIERFTRMIKTIIFPFGVTFAN